VGCQGGNPILSQSCTFVPTCTDLHWNYLDGVCQQSNTLTRTWTKIANCQNGIQHTTTETIQCTYNAPQCNYTYSNWGECINGLQTRTYVANNNPCQGAPITSQPCTLLPICTENHWAYSLSQCTANNTQTKTWVKISDCNLGITRPETETISCQNNISYCTDSDWQSRVEPIECPSIGIQTKYWTRTSTQCQAGVTHKAIEIQACAYVPPIISPECSADENCASNEICSNGNCVEKPPVVPALECTSNNGCKASEECVLNKCKAIVCGSNYSMIGHKCVCSGAVCGDNCFTGTGVCCSNVWNSGLVTCEYDLGETIQIVNQARDSEASDLMQTAISSINNGNLVKGQAEAKAAELKAKLSTMPSNLELETTYEQIKAALQSEDYEQANTLAVKALDEIDSANNSLSFLNQLTPLIVIALIVLVLLLIFSRKKPKAPPKTTGLTKDQVKELLKHQAKELAKQ
jgi:hypothetical protein